MSTLPTLTHITNITIYPETTQCPHCGAIGKKVYTAQTKDGHIIQAMSGCIKLFPVVNSYVFQNSMRIVQKEIDYMVKGWNLPKYDQRILDVIQLMVNGTYTPKAAEIGIGEILAAQSKNRKRW